MKTIDEVRSFWERNPLFSGESQHEIGSDAYYQEHRRVVIQDGFAGRLDPRLLPPEHNRDNVLDIGCGPGMWLVELQLQCGIDKMSGVDLTSTAIKLSEKRLRLYGLQADLFVQNVETLAFADNSFSHVNCLGVIHHTPNTEKAISEVSRVVRPGGSATISVYYKNIFIRNFGLFSVLYFLLHKAGVKLRGRGREDFHGTDVDEFIRAYDGSDNPIGKGYTRQEYEALLSPYFRIDEIYYHFFPAKSLPIRIPNFLHRWLNRRVPFMICANITKR